MRRDQRGLATGLLGLAAILVVAALLYTLTDPAAVKIFELASDTTTNQQAQDAIDQRERIWNLVLYAILFIASVYIIARAVFESRRPG
jgi:hypothetical protein